MTSPAQASASTAPGTDHGTPGPVAPSLVLSDVYLLTATSDGRQAVPGLAVTIDGTGMTVRKPDGQVAGAVPWAAMTGFEARRRMRTPSGSQGVVLEASTPTRTHRFLVPTADPAGLERAVAAVAGPCGAADAAHPGPPIAQRSRLVLGVAIVLIAVGIALAVLVMTGAVNF